MTVYFSPRVLGANNSMRAIRSQLSQVVAAAITIAASLAVLVIAPNATAWAQDTASPNRHSVAEEDSTMVRFSLEHSTNTVLFKFVADEAGNLSAGTLYAAKATRNEDERLGLEWIELGNGNDGDIAFAIATLQLPE